MWTLRGEEARRDLAAAVYGEIRAGNIGRERRGEEQAR